MPRSLTSEATLAHLTGPLPQRREFVRKVLENFHSPNVDRHTTKVFIGLQGKGKMPHYRFDFPTVILISEKEVSIDQSKIFNGANHKQMTAFEAEQIKPENWSGASMDYNQVSALLGELRKVSN